MFKAKALFDCTADDDAELTFTEGDIIVDVVPSVEDGWFEGRLEGSNKRGLFPHNYVQIFEETPKPAPPSRPTQLAKPADTTLPVSASNRPSTSSTSSSWSNISTKDDSPASSFQKPNTWTGFGSKFDTDQPVKASATRDVQDAFGAAKPGKLPTTALSMFATGVQPAVAGSRSKPDVKPKSALVARPAQADDDTEVDNMPSMSVKALRASLEGAAGKPATSPAIIAARSLPTTRASPEREDEDEPPTLLRPSAIKQQQQPSSSDTPTFLTPKPLSARKPYPNPLDKPADDDVDSEPQTLRPSAIRRQQQQQFLGVDPAITPATKPRSAPAKPVITVTVMPSVSASQAAAATAPQPKPEGLKTRSASHSEMPINGGVSVTPMKPGLSAAAAGGGAREPPVLPRRPGGTVNGVNGSGGLVVQEEESPGVEPPKLPQRPKPKDAATQLVSTTTPPTTTLSPRLPSRPAAGIATRPELPPRKVSSGSVNAAVMPPAPPRPKKHNPFEENDSRSGIPPDARQRYEMVFDANHVDGFMDGEAVRKIWAKSRLDPKTLAKIWNLADMDEDGFLNQREFCVGMHLIDERLRGFPVPETLPMELRAA